MDDLHELCDHVGSGGNLPGAAAGAGYHLVGRLISIAALGTGTPARTLSDGTGGVWLVAEFARRRYPDYMACLVLVHIHERRRRASRWRPASIYVGGDQSSVDRPGYLSRIASREKGALKDQRQVRLFSGLLLPQDVIIHIHSGALQTYARSSVYMCGCRYVLHHATFFAGWRLAPAEKRRQPLVWARWVPFRVIPICVSDAGRGISVRTRQLPLFRARFLFSNLIWGREKQESEEYSRKKRKTTKGQLNTHTHTPSGRVLPAYQASLGLDFATPPAAVEMHHGR